MLPQTDDELHISILRLGWLAVVTLLLAVLFLGREITFQGYDTDWFFGPLQIVAILAGLGAVLWPWLFRLVTAWHFTACLFLLSRTGGLVFLTTGAEDSSESNAIALQGVTYLVVFILVAVSYATWRLHAPRSPNGVD